MADLGGVLIFAATDPAHGTELWRSDGTAAGTALIKDINPDRSRRRRLRLRLSSS